MTANVLVPGHIKLLIKLFEKGDVVVGLLTSKALKGYKKERMPFKDRKYILERISLPLTVVAQDTLSPEVNLIKYQCDAIASGDGWEKSELDTIKKLGIKKINVKSGHKLHSSDL